jgi:hypothetical protein
MNKATGMGRLLFADVVRRLQGLSRQFLRDVQRKVFKEEE